MPARGGTRYVGLTLGLARSVLPAQIPDAAFEQLVPGGIDPRVLEAAKALNLSQTRIGQPMSLFRMLGASSTTEKVKFAWDRVFLSREELAERYPAALGSRHLALYYARRLWDVFLAYVHHACARARPPSLGQQSAAGGVVLDWLESSRS
ncbi:hypothetical protein FJY70_02825 [candidate division WOR-3 bacterium]|nr:hypothetical protein [candidate division WOR-3 bacterium]